MTIDRTLISAEISYFDNNLRATAQYEQLHSEIIADAVHAAICLAYNDAKRTMRGIAAFQKQKEDALADIEHLLVSYFSNPAPCCNSDFDQLHDELCSIWCNAFSQNSLATYGKAQKIINMAFKYLRCRKDAECSKKHFQFCHMPLDSYTLEWMRRNIPECPPKLVWSNLNGNTYNTCVRLIHNYIQSNHLHCSAMELEFIVWPKIIRELAAENFLLSLTSDIRKKDLQKMSLSEKYCKICELLK